MPEQDRTYLQTQTITIPCDRRKHFEDIPITLPAGAPEGTWTFSAPSGKFQIRLTLANGKISGELIPGAEGGNCCLESLGDRVVLPLHFPDLLLQITLSCPNPPPTPGVGHEDAARGGDTWLCLDIGNTRTCALLDLPDPEIAFYKVKHRKGDPGTCNSLCAAQAPTAGGEDVAFVVMGKSAADLLRDVPAAGTVFSLSTPKRYFWDDQPNAHLTCVSADHLVEIAPSVIPFVDGLSGYKVHPDGRGFPSRQLFMQGAILELLERAEATVGELRDWVKENLPDKDFLTRVNSLRIGANQLNLDENYDKVNELVNALRGLNEDFITDLVCTCPAAWLQDQRRAYRELIEDTVNAYRSPAKKCHPLKFHMECDEATAVLMSYLKRECDKAIAAAEETDSPLRNWLYQHGKIRTTDNGNRNAAKVVCRIGVLDVGGGTSDLSIAELTYTTSRERGEQINYEQVCTNGTDQAGDFLLLQITLKILVPMVAAWLLNSTQFNEDGTLKQARDWETYLAWFRRVLKDGIGNKARKFARSFWFELAVKAMEQADHHAKEEGEIPLKIDPKEVMKEEFEDFWSFIQEAFSSDKPEKEYVKEGFKTDATAWENKLYPYCNENGVEVFKELEWRDWMGDGKTLSQLYRECIETALGFTAKLMSATLLANNCDLVLFSGKTMENDLVKAFFVDYLPMECHGLASGKEDTAKGAEYYVRRDDPEMDFRIQINAGGAESKDEDFYWVVGESLNPLVTNRGSQFEYVTNLRETVIKRKKFRNFGNPMPCYKLINRGEVRNSLRYKCILKYNEDLCPPRLQLISVTLDGKECQKDKWELKINMSNTGTSWLDTGIITEKE